MEARSAAERAVALDPNLTEGWNILASIRLYREWDFSGAEAACRRVIELDPRTTSARQRYIDVLRVPGRIDEARSELEGAIQLQPAAAAFRVRRALVLYENREFDQAITEARTASNLTNQMPVFSLTFWLRGLALEGQGRFAEAEEVFREALIHQPHDPLIEPSLGHLLARTGRKMEAESVLAELRAQVERGRLTYTAQAIVLAGLGRNEEALRALEEGLAQRDDSLLAAPRDPRFQTLRSDPRFQAVVSGMTGGAMSTV